MDQLQKSLISHNIQQISESYGDAYLFPQYWKFCEEEDEKTKQNIISMVKEPYWTKMIFVNWHPWMKKQRVELKSCKTCMRLSRRIISQCSMAVFSHWKMGVLKCLWTFLSAKMVAFLTSISDTFIAYLFFCTNQWPQIA